MLGWDRKLASCIDHTLLKKDLSEADIKKVCEEANFYGFKGVCLYKEHIAMAKHYLNGPLAIAVVDFPMGQSSKEEKSKEALEALVLGALEIDMVMNYQAVKEKRYLDVYLEIESVVKAAQEAKVKVILECCYLDHDEKVVACALAKAAKASYVKTSTGFGQSGASKEDVALLRKIVGDDMGVKASGGIRDRKEALEMISAGADRLGTSQSVKIVNLEEGGRL